MQRAVEGGQGPSLWLLDRFSRRLPAPPREPGARRKKCISQRLGNLWRTDNGDPTFPTKLTRYALLSFPLLDPDTPLVPPPLTHADPNNFYSLFGQTRCTMRRDVSILERTAPACRPEAGEFTGLTVGDHPGWIVRGECARWTSFRLNRPIFYDSRNPFNVIFSWRNGEHVENSLFSK